MPPSFLTLFLGIGTFFLLGTFCIRLVLVEMDVSEEGAACLFPFTFFERVRIPLVRFPFPLSPFARSLPPPNNFSPACRPALLSKLLAVFCLVTTLRLRAPSSVFHQGNESPSLSHSLRRPRFFPPFWSKADGPLFGFANLNFPSMISAASFAHRCAQP